MSLIYVQITYVAHVTACFWYYLGKVDTYSNPDGFYSTWIEQYVTSAYSGVDRYGASIYYVVYTMLGIGYGDIHPVNTGYAVRAFTCAIHDG
jgi:hypothetical protein